MNMNAPHLYIISLREALIVLLQAPRWILNSSLSPVIHLGEKISTHYLEKAITLSLKSYRWEFRLSPLSVPRSREPKSRWDGQMRYVKLDPWSVSLGLNYRSQARAPCCRSPVNKTTLSSGETLSVFIACHTRWGSREYHRASACIWSFMISWPIFLSSTWVLRLTSMTSPRRETWQSCIFPFQRWC